MQNKMAFTFPCRIKEPTFGFENLLEKYFHRFTMTYLPRARDDNTHTNRNILNVLSKTKSMLIFIHSHLSRRQKMGYFKGDENRI